MVLPLVAAFLAVVLLLVLGRTPLRRLVRRVRVGVRRALRRRQSAEDTSHCDPKPGSLRRSSARLQSQLEREIQQQKSPSRAINVLVRRISLELRGGFVAVVEAGEGSEARVTNSRGLTDASHRLHLDPSLREALDHGPVALTGRALRRTSLFESLAPRDRRRIRHGISLIPIGPAPVTQWLLTTALLPLDACEEQQRERLAALCRMAWNRRVEASSTRRTEPRSGGRGTPRNPFTSPSSQIRDVLDEIRTAAGIDRASLFLLTSTGTLTLGPTVTVGGRLPPGVELKWREQERRLGLALLTTGGFEHYDEADLARLKIGSLWNAAWGNRVVLRGQTIGVLCATAGRTLPEDSAIRELIRAASNEITRVFERMLPHSASRSATESAETRQTSETALVNRPALRESPNGHTTPPAWSQDFAIPKNVAAAFLSVGSPSLRPTPEATPAERRVAEPSTPLKPAQRVSANTAPAASDDGRLQFLANMTHELRAPMTGILGMTEIVLDTNLTDQQRRCLASVRSSSQSLLQLVNDLLDFSKLESRGVEIERTEFSLRSLLREALLPMAVQARQKGLAFHCETPQDLCDDWRGDPLRLRQVVTNLVGNALKFTDAGQISVRIEPFAETHVRISVTDTGPGIPADRRQRIFQAYAQADASTARKHGGTGLGLAISRQLVELMDGQIWLESEVGRGSTFSFTVRLERVAEGSAPVETRPDPPAASRLRILVVDDHEINRQVARLKLEARGHTVEAAAGGREACDAFAQWPFDVILMDVQMSDLDGLTAARAIRRRERPTGRRIPIFALTSTADAESRARCFEAGMDEVLLKPIDPLAIETRLQGLVQDRETLAPAAIAEESQRAPSRSEWNATAAGNRPAGLRTPPHLANIRESFLPMFLESAEDFLDELRSGLAADDFERIQRAAHSFSGSAGTLGYDDLSRQAGLVEEFARRHKRTSIEPLLEQIVAGLEECRQELPLSNGAASHRPLISVPCP